tara:strand:- start:166 stop:318 length:153 start_codon:yes stop_codon:yes gene_type:complete
MHLDGGVPESVEEARVAVEGLSIDINPLLEQCHEARRQHVALDLRAECNL